MITVEFLKPYRGVLVDGLAEVGDVVKIDPKKFENEIIVAAEANFLALLDCGVIKVLKGKWPSE